MGMGTRKTWRPRRIQRLGLFEASAAQSIHRGLNLNAQSFEQTREVNEVAVIACA